MVPASKDNTAVKAATVIFIVVDWKGLGSLMLAVCDTGQSYVLNRFVRDEP